MLGTDYPSKSIVPRCGFHPTGYVEVSAMLRRHLISNSRPKIIVSIYFHAFSLSVMIVMVRIHIKMLSDKTHFSHFHTMAHLVMNLFVT